MKKLLLALSMAALAAVSCTSTPKCELGLFDKANFEATIDGKPVSLYTLTNDNGLTMQVTNFGARVVALWTPDAEGKMEDIVLGYESLDRYINNTGERFLGATIGRYGNRIAKGRFTLDGEEYVLSTYNNGQCLHGGDKGFDMVVWSVESVSKNSILFSYTSADMEEGFPGKLTIEMSYTLTPDNEFEVVHRAKTDKRTVLNLTHHSFFNLKGEGNGTINDHILCIAADGYTPIDEVSIPFGTVDAVEGTPFDFRVAKAIGQDIATANQQLSNGAGYDHNWVLNRKSEGDLEFAASVLEPTSGRYMEVWTTEPALQFYGGNFFDGKVAGKREGKTHNYRESLALETQHYPDSPNQPSFPSTILNPEDDYYHACVYRFSTK